MSSYNIKDKFIYIHIPKTAGTSMEQVSWIGTGMQKHGDMEYFNEMAKHTQDGELDLDKYWKWCFVRNPYTKFMSGVINHVLKGRFIDLGTEGKRNHDIMKKEITKFITRYGEGYNYPRHAAQSRETDFNRFIVLRQQSEFVTVDGKNVMDFVGKFENLEEDFNKVCDRLGKPHVKLLHRVRGFKIDYDSLYTEETRRIIKNYYSKDFEIFGYEK